jgi:hypothetical protein
MDLARQLVERHAIAILRPHFKALGLMLEDDGSTTLLDSGAVVVYQGEATSASYDNLPANNRLSARGTVGRRP